MAWNNEKKKQWNESVNRVLYSRNDGTNHFSYLNGKLLFGFIGFLRVMGVKYESYWALCLFLYLALSQSFFQRHSLF